MVKRKKRWKKKAPSGKVSPGQAESDREARFEWIPLWGWVLVFLVPLFLSEYMFYVGGRTVSMILFPIAWIGFWVAMMYQSDWSIFKKKR